MVTRKEFDDVYRRVAKKLNKVPPSPMWVSLSWEGSNQDLHLVSLEDFEEILEEELNEFSKMDAPVTRKIHDEIIIKYAKKVDSVPTKKSLDQMWNDSQWMPPLSLKDFENSMFETILPNFFSRN